MEARRYATAAFTEEQAGLNFHGAIVPSYDLRLNSRRLASSWLTGTPYHWRWVTTVSSRIVR
ncbi:hypothetical protein AB5I41_24885 [Sphingomonas sp. MMS24-JH45]